MTTVFMEGFEAVIDKLDMVSRGWRMGTYPNYTNQDVMTVPSRTGTPGRGLFLRGPYYSASVNFLPFCGDLDFGMIDTGQSVYSLWQAGGFVVGMNAAFNSSTQLQLAHNLPHQITYDGSQYYWAIGQNGSTWCVCYSTDLVNWTQAPTSPANISADSTIAVMGSGPSATILCGQSLVSLNGSYYYSTNMGQTWTPTPVVSGGMKQPIVTGVGATPIMMVFAPNNSGPIGVLYQTSPGAAPVQVTGLTVAPGNSYSTGVAKLVNGIVCFSASSSAASPTTPSGNSSYWQCAPVTADLTKSTSYVQSATLSNKQMTDITFFNDTWIAVGYGGIFTAPNSGTPSVPAGPTATWSTVVTANLNYGVYSIDTNGSIVVAVGSDPVNQYIGAIWTSTDGVNWTKSNRFQFASTTVANGNCFTNVFWDGHQFVLTGGVNANTIATSPDGIAWTGLYYPDYGEGGGATNASPLGVFSGTITPGSYVGGGQSGPGGFTPWSTANTNMVGWGFNAGPPVTTNGVTTRTVTGLQVPGGTTTVTVVNSGSANQAVLTTPLAHFFEIIATAVAGTTNQFMFQFAIDGIVLPGSFGPYYFAAAGDTGSSHLFVNLPRTGNWTVIDDIYVTTMNGTNNVGQLGVSQVLPTTTMSDAQAQYSRSGSQASDAAAVAGPLSNSEGYVYATGVGTKDIYNTSSPVPAGYRVRAVQVEAFFSKYGATGATATVGLVSGATELDSAPVGAYTPTPVYAAVLADTDPNTGTAWSVDSAKAVRFAVTKAS